MWARGQGAAYALVLAGEALVDIALDEGGLAAHGAAEEDHLEVDLVRHGPRAKSAGGCGAKGAGRQMYRRYDVRGEQEEEYEEEHEEEHEGRGRGTRAREKGSKRE